MTARVCSRSLVVFNPLLVNLPPSSHDGGTSSWIQLPHFFCSDLSLILLKPSQARSTATSTCARHTAKNALMGSLQSGPAFWSGTRSITPKDQQRLRIYRSRNSKAIGVIISLNLWSSVGLFGCNKSNFEGEREIFDLILAILFIFYTWCFGFVTVSWQNGNLGNNHPSAIFDVRLILIKIGRFSLWRSGRYRSIPLKLV